MALDVNVKIKLTSGAGTDGFGIPLILVSHADSAVAYHECATASEVKLAGFAEGSEAYKLFVLMKAQDNAPRRIALIQTTEGAVDALKKLTGVRQVVAVLGGDDKAADVSAYVEGRRDLIYFPVLNATDGLAAYAKRERTMIGVHSDGQKLAAALVGATAGMDAGSFTYKNIILQGIEPDAERTEEEVLSLSTGSGSGGTCAYTIARKAGDLVTTEGKAASGEYLDIVDSFDWIIQGIENSAQKLLNGSPKLPYDNRGIGMLEGVTANVLKQADNMGMIAHNAAGEALYATEFGGVDATKAADRKERNYALGRFTFTLAGAIHTAEINGTVTI
nr:MAG TPA: tail sheath protein [Caudoviricetes sp.]